MIKFFKWLSDRFFDIAQGVADSFNPFDPMVDHPVVEQYRQNINSSNPFEADKRALAGDWKNVESDLTKAMEKIRNQKLN